MDQRNERFARETAELRELLLQVRKSSSESDEMCDGFGVLMERYLPLIEKTVERFSGGLVSDTDRDDLRQEALMSFYRAALSFDLSQSAVSFGLYARICMTNRMVSCMRAYKKHGEEQPLPISDGMYAQEDPLSEAEEEERLRNTYDVIRRVLSPFEYTVWHHYVGGATAKEIASRLGKSEKSVSNAISRIRQKLRAARAEFCF